MTLLLGLRNAAVTFGGDPLWTGVDLALSAGDKACLVGRNGSGKSTILKALAGTIDLDGGERFVQPGIRIAYLAQEPDLTVHATVADYVASALPADRAHDHWRVEQVLARGQARRRPVDRHPVGRGGAARRHRPRRGRRARRAAAGRADQPSRPADHRMARGRAQGLARRAAADQPRPCLPERADPAQLVARPRRAAADGQALRRVRRMERDHPGAGGGGAGAARQADRVRDHLVAPGHQRPAQAQPGPPAQPLCACGPNAGRRSTARASRRWASPRPAGARSA